MNIDKKHFYLIYIEFVRIYEMFVFPMSGRGERFLIAGYDTEKYLLMVGGKTILECALLSFEKYFLSDKFILVMRNDDVNVTLVRDLITSIGIRDFSIISIDESLGQADTVKRGIQIAQLEEPDVFLGNQELYIFNIDSFLFGFTKFDQPENVRGALDVFFAPSDHFSFVVPDRQFLNTVCRVTEKVRVSDLASTGLYYFKYVEDFINCIKELGESVISEYGELFVAPLYNYLIGQGLTIKYREVKSSEIVILGTPGEYENYAKKEI